MRRRRRIPGAVVGVLSAGYGVNSAEVVSNGDTLEVHNVSLPVGTTLPSSDRRQVVRKSQSKSPTRSRTRWRPRALRHLVAASYQRKETRRLGSSQPRTGLHRTESDGRRTGAGTTPAVVRSIRESCSRTSTAVWTRPCRRPLECCWRALHRRAPWPEACGEVLAARLSSGAVTAGNRIRTNDLRV